MKLYGEIDSQDIPANEKRAIEFLMGAIKIAKSAGHRVDVEKGRVVIHWDECPPKLSKGVPIRLVIHTQMMLYSRMVDMLCYEDDVNDWERHLFVRAESEYGDGEWLCVELVRPDYPIGDNAASFLLLVLFDRMRFQLDFHKQLMKTIPPLVDHALQERALNTSEELLDEIAGGNDTVLQQCATEALRNIVYGVGGRLAAMAVEELTRRLEDCVTAGMTDRLDSRCPEVRLAAMNHLFAFQSPVLDRVMLEFLATDLCPVVAARAAHLLSLMGSPGQ